jgi:hypothetical protein
VDRTQLVPSETINLSEDLSSQVSVLLQLTTLQELEDENKKIDQLSFLLRIGNLISAELTLLQLTQTF